MEFIATFGQGWTLRNNFVRLTADSENIARRLLFDAYGSAWAFIYDSERAAGVEEYRLIEVPFGTKNERL